MIDPACGTGTFLVEALRVEVDRLKAAGALQVETAQELLGSINGLDINPFSVSLSQIQILWHIMDLFKGQPADVVSEAASNILPHIMVDGGISSLDTMGMPMATPGQSDLDLGSGKAQSEGRRMQDYPARFRQINGRAYDVGVGNPPYVRAARRTKDHLSSDYDRVLKGQVDLYVPFVFRALKWWLKPGGRMGLIIPMAVLDAVYAEALRSVVAEYRLVEIIDLELLRKKTFHGVKRPTVILVIENTPATEDDTVTITTVPPEAHDPVMDHVDMKKSRNVTLPRKEIILSSYLSATFRADKQLVELSGISVGPGSELTTKVVPDDVPVLKRIGRARKLISDVDIVWTKKGEPPTLAAPPIARRTKWKAAPLIQYGLKLGGDDALSAENGSAVYRGLNIFPGRILGDPAGRWAIGKETSANIYSYRSLLRTDCLFASREIAQVPTMTKVPEGAVFQNTVLIIQLSKQFPLNVWVLSRIIQFYCAKLLRGSVIEDITAHWYKRQLSLLPMPKKVDDQLVATLTLLGDRLFAADREIADEYEALDAITDAASSSLLDLVASSNPLTDGFSAAQIAEDDMTVTSVAKASEGIQLNGELEIKIDNPDLRRWLLHRFERELDAGQSETSRKHILGQRVPDALDAALLELDRLAASNPTQTYEDTLDELDAVVASTLELEKDDAAYIKEQLNTDDFLAAIAPSLERRGLSKQTYRGDDAGGPGS